MFKHLLITRFNLKNPEWKQLTKNNESLLDDSWMNERLELFANYCFPSVSNQTNQNFEWLLYFDVSTSENHKNKIAEIIGNKTNIKSFFIDGMPVFNESIIKYVEENISTEYLITSRIDNDDCIHKDFINEIQKHFDKQDFLAIDNIEGYTLQIEPNFILGKKEHIFNPFISLIEKNDQPKTVWHYVHNMWKKEPRLIHVTEKRLWLSVIHGKNKVNEFDGYGNIKWNSLKNDFIVSDKVSQKIENDQLPFSKWWFLSLRNFLYVKRVLLSKQLKKMLGVYKK
ncbi:glycosyltransferase [Flavobacterium haoranii]|uniref:Putative rhamnosyl transferase n=1 Tax=Flavobacterium haoranii TaxID=683124 RepID=A0A1M6JYE2_9FLAO|nr:glycosyltransferase [Flavobacterium haoranii]SHJ51737.1 Putative rhamnosyl transferase [Flavobacterium haoranii]